MHYKITTSLQLNEVTGVNNVLPAKQYQILITQNRTGQKLSKKDLLPVYIEYTLECREFWRTVHDTIKKFSAWHT